MFQPTRRLGCPQPGPEPPPQPLSPPVYRTPRPKQFGWTATIIAVVGAFWGWANDEPNEEPTEEPTTAGFIPRKSDFEIGIKILEKKCFGSVGCSVTHRIKPKYVGTQELN
jgi:hypothetical protein